MVADIKPYVFGRCHCPHYARWQMLMPLIVIHDKSCVRLSMEDAVTIVADGIAT